MKQTQIRRSTPLERGKPLETRTRLSRYTGLHPGPWSHAVPLLDGTSADGRITASRAEESPAAGSRVPAKAKNAATGRPPSSSGRAESFPKDVAALIDARDPWCIHCGTPFNLHRHHRRGKGIGGDPRPHTDCACNGVRLCLRCHLEAHDTEAGRREAEAEGLIIPRATLEPWTENVLVHLEDDRGGMRKWPSCDGRWLDYVPESEAA